MLLMGIDSTEEGLDKNAVANGDSLMLVTFNPKTLNATMLSIPRDSYVPISCFVGKYENKITHAAWHGTDCMMQTIEDYFGITIDYYAKVNFKGLVHLVDAVGGIDVEVPADLTPILITEASMAAFKGRDATMVLIIVYLRKFKIILVTAAITPTIMTLAILSFDFRSFSKTR